MGLLSRMGRAATELSKYYYPFTWRNKPSIESPINEVHLNHIEDGINEMDNRILILAQDKADATDIANVFVDFAMDDTTGVMTFTRFDGSKVEHDSAVEKIALNCYLEDDNFVLELADGTKQKVSLSKFIDTYTFSSTDTIRMTVNGKNVSAEIPDGKITLAKLEPTIMSTIRQYTLDAQTAQGVAEQAAGTAQGWAIGGTGFEDNNAKHYASRSQRYAVGGVEEGDTKDNAKYYCQKAQAAAEQAAGSAAYDGTATSVKATDTQGLVVSAGGDSNTQVLLDVLARKVAQELVSDSGLATKLADYVKKTDIVQTESTATDKVPSSAYLKQALGTINSNLGAELVTNDVLSYALGVGRGFYVIRTDNTTANTPKDYMSGYIVKRFVNPNQVTIVLFELGKTKPYYNSYNGSAWSGWVTGLQDSDFARESTDLNTAFNGIGAISMYNWSNATLHTPHKEGITVYGNGFAIGFDIGSFKVQVAFVVGENRIFIRSLRDGGAFSTWVAK